MSMLSKAIKSVGKGAKKLVTRPGDWAKSIAKQAVDPKTLMGIAGTLALPGVGSTLGAIPGLGALGGAASGAIKTVGSIASKIPGVGAVTSAAGKVKGVTDAIGKSGIGQAARALNGGKAITAGSMLQGGIKNVTSNPDLILGGIAGLEGYKDAREADRMRDAALNDPRLRSTARPDYSDVFSTYQNPYTRPIKTVGGRY